MSDQQIHHIVNHLPSIGQVIGLGLLIVALLRKNASVIQAGAWVILISALFVLPTNFTGENSEEKVEHLAGVNHKQVHEHEEAAETAFTFTLISGALALVFLVASWRKWSFDSIALWLVVIASVVSVYFLYQASHQGGMIRHPELGSPVSTGGGGPGGEAEDHD